ncbi:MAG: TonB-dependent receptor, partial [Burkholderiaceae bacterium]|nr:TonB-dependent receptor [Burkholderiaceae bacterium]
MKFQHSPVAMAVFATGILGAGHVAQAQPTTPAPVAPAQLERVEVTGSAIKRIDAETSLPVQVLSREDIARTGVTTAEGLLRTITAIDAAGTLVSANGAGLNTGGISTASLRGLGSARTLVLVNGRRIAPYGSVGDSASVDVNSIPIQAIERVEVLKEGASAVYGSDAIAGVINFILRREYTGASISAEYGQTISGGGGGKQYNIAGSYGFGSLDKDRFNVSILATYQKTDAIYGADRRYATISGISVNPDPNSQLNNDPSSGNTYPGNIASSSTGATIGNPLAGNCGPFSVTSPFFSPNVCRFDPSPYVTLLPEAENWSLFGSGRFAITKNLEAFAELSYTHRDIFTQIQPVPLSDQFALPATNPLFAVDPFNGASTFLLRPGSPYYPASYIASRGGDPTEAVLVRYRAFESGVRQTRDVAEIPRVVLGIQGDGMGWDFNATYLWTESKLTESVEGGFPQLTKVLPLLDSGLVNPFGPSSPAIQQALRAANFNGDTYVNKSSMQSIGAGASRDLMALSGGPLAIALGAEFRREGYNAQPSALLIQGDVSGYGGNQAVVDVHRNVTSFYGEINAPLAKTFEAGAAIRWDDYEGTGSKTTGRVSGKWTPMNGLLFRGSAGTGFRAPSLTALYATNTEGVSVPGVDDPLRCPTTNSSIDCATQFATTIGGSPTLKPETSENYTLGAIWEPTNQLSFGVDAWWIDIKDTILIGGITVPTILADLGRYGSLVTRGPADAAFPGLPGPITNILQTNINQGTTSVQGYDFNASFRPAKTDYGLFSVNLNATYYDKYDITLPDGTVVHAAGTLDTTAAGPIPKWKTYLTLNWQYGPWGATLANRYQGGYRDSDGNASAVV